MSLGRERVEWIRDKRSLKRECAELFESTIAIVGNWGKEIGVDSVVGRDRSVGSVERSLFTIGQFSVAYHIPSFDINTKDSTCTVSTSNPKGGVFIVFFFWWGGRHGCYW